MNVTISAASRAVQIARISFTWLTLIERFTISMDPLL